MTESRPPPESIRDKVVAGALWLIFTRWAHRLIGLASTMVLARVLMPEDFGIVAAVTAVVAILDGFLEFGFDLALIRARDPQREDFDTTWTLKVIKGLVFGGAVIAVSPWVADFSGTPDIVLISVAIGLGLMVRCCENIGIVRFEKELEYDRLFKVRLYPRLAGAFTTIVLALVLRSYWAIVLGTVLQNVYQAGFSYLLCSFRPRFRLQGAAAIWGFSKWILVSAACRQIFGAVDRFVLSGWVGKRDLGFFSVTSSLGAMITNELVGAVGTALIPGYAKLQDERTRLRAAFLMSQAAFVALLIPATAGTALLAPQMTAVILGAQWLDAAPMLAGFALFYMTYTVVENLNRFMAMTGLQQLAAQTGLIRTVCFLILVYPVFQYGGIIALIEMKIGLSLIEILFLARHCCHRIDTPLTGYLAVYTRPLVATVLMGFLVATLDAFDLGSTLMELALCASTGGLTYAVTSFALWHLTGRPAGLETIVMDLIARRGRMGQ